MILNDRQLLSVVGGSITPTFINAISKGISTIVDLGRSLGSSIRRVVSGKICPVD